jgi:nucleotide-binding universal stress UspA family protein
MASQHRSGLERVVPGSVTDQVVRQAADPVLVVAPLVSDSSD